MRVVKQIIAQQADILNEPTKKKRRCEAECTEHQFIIHQTLKNSKNMDISMNFCPKYHRGDLPPENTFPEFNKDGIFYTSAFILGVDKKLSQKIQKEEQIEHVRIVRLTYQKNCLVRFPKPNSNHTLCSVCKVNYGNYLKHILSEFHKERVNNCPYNHHIADLSKQFKHLHPQDLTNVSSPFVIAVKGEELQSINSKKQINSNQQQQSQKIIQEKPNTNNYQGEKKVILLQNNKKRKIQQNGNGKIMRKKYRNKSGPSLTKSESSSSLSSDSSSSSSSSNSSSSSSTSSNSDSKSSFSSDKYKKPNKSSCSSSSSSISSSSSSLSSISSMNSLSSKNISTLKKNDYQSIPIKEKIQDLDMAIKKKTKKKSNGPKKQRKNSLRKNGQSKQKKQLPIKNNQQSLKQTSGKRKKKKTLQKQLNGIEPLVKICKKRKKRNIDKKIKNQEQVQKDIEEECKISKQITLKDNNVVSENMKQYQAQCPSKIENQQNLINQCQKHVYSLDEVLIYPAQIDLPPPKQCHEFKHNIQNTKSISSPDGHPQHKQMSPLKKSLLPEISQPNLQIQQKLNMSQKQSSIQNKIQIKEILKDKLRQKMTAFKKCESHSQLYKKKEEQNQIIRQAQFQSQVKQNATWVDDWKRASSISLTSPLSKKFINNNRQILQQQLYRLNQFLIDVDDENDLSEKQINDDKQTDYSDFKIKQKLISKKENKPSSNDLFKFNIHNGRSSLQKVSDFLIEQYAKFRQLSKDGGLPEDVSTYLSNDFNFRND